MPEKSNDRTAEIWSSRLQKELLTLTTGESMDDGKGAVLPPFISVAEHHLDITGAYCKVTFRVEISSSSSSPSSTDNTPSSDSDSDSDDYVLVTLDASMHHEESTGKLMAHKECYPFQKPVAVLTLGAHKFPSGSTIRDGDVLSITNDWTPSLQLADAALNIALLIRESIKRAEPVHLTPPTLPGTPHKSAESNNSNSSPLESLLQKFSVSSSSSSSLLPKKKKKQQQQQHPQYSHPQRPPPAELPQRRSGGLSVGDVIDLHAPPYNRCAGLYSCKSIRRPRFVQLALQEYEAHKKALQESVHDEQGNDYSNNNSNSNSNNSSNNMFLRLQAGSVKKVAESGMAGANSIFKGFLSSAKSVMEDTFLMITDDHIVEIRSSKFNLGSATVTFANPISMLAKLKFRRQESISLFFKQASDDPAIYMCPDSADCVLQIQSVLKRHGVAGKHTNATTQKALQQALQLVAEIQHQEKLLESNPTVPNVDHIMSLYRQAAERFESAGDARHEEVMNHLRKFLKRKKIVAILDGSYTTSDKHPTNNNNNNNNNTHHSQKHSHSNHPNQQQHHHHQKPQGEILRPTHDQLNDDDDNDNDNDHDDDNNKQSFKESPLMDHNLDELSRDMDMPVLPDDASMGSFDSSEADDDDLGRYLHSSQSKSKGTANTSSTTASVEDELDPMAELDAMFTAADKELADILNS